MTTDQMNASTPDNVNFIRKIEQICFFLHVLFRDRICEIKHKSATARLYTYYNMYYWTPHRELMWLQRVTKLEMKKTKTNSFAVDVDYHKQCVLTFQTNRLNAQRHDILERLAN